MTSREYDSTRRCLFRPGDIALVIGGHGFPYTRVLILAHLRELTGKGAAYHRYTARYLDGPHQGRVRKFQAQDLILEKDYLSQLSPNP